MSSCLPGTAINQAGSVAVVGTYENLLSLTQLKPQPTIAIGRRGVLQEHSQCWQEEKTVFARSTSSHRTGLQ